MISRTMILILWWKGKWITPLGSHEKAREIKKMYRQAAAEGKKKDVKYVVAKKHHAAKRASRPAGTKGPYKQVPTPLAYLLVYLS